MQVSSQTHNGPPFLLLIINSSVKSSEAPHVALFMSEIASLTLSPSLVATGGDGYYAFIHFALDVWNVNAELLNGNLLKSVFHEFVNSWGPIAYLLMSVMCCSSVFAILMAQKLRRNTILRNLTMAFAELMAILIFLTPAFLPFKAVRFVVGLLAFALFMSLHSKIVTTEPVKGTFVAQLKSALSFNTREHLTIKTHPSLPSQSVIIRYVALLACTDGCMFLIKEFIPMSITNSSGRMSAINIITGFWAYFSLELNYTQSTMVCNFLGNPLPMKFRHNNPFMSISLSEFWGVRWNPIICKLLQSSFYVPLRKLGVPRFICVMSCFLGSGLLHAIPVYISSYNMKNAIAMGSFFIIQGALVLTEQSFCMMTGWTSKSAHTKSGNSVVTTEDIATVSDLIPYIGDISLMIGSFTLLFYIIQGKATIMQLTILIGCFLVSSSAVLYVQLRNVMKQYDHAAHTVKIVDLAPQANDSIDKTNERNQVELHAATESISINDSFRSVTDVGQLSQASSRYPSFTSSAKLIEESQPISMNAAKKALAEYSGKNSEGIECIDDFSTKWYSWRTLRIATWVLCGWLWTATMIALPLPLFCGSIDDIGSTLYHQSIFIGPLVRSMQYLK